jgi:hypothetical protein
MADLVFSVGGFFRPWGAEKASGLENRNKSNELGINVSREAVFGAAKREKVDLKFAHEFKELIFISRNV